MLSTVDNYVIHTSSFHPRRRSGLTLVEVVQLIDTVPVASSCGARWRNFFRDKIGEEAIGVPWNRCRP
jgi:hypothetical protein